MKWFGEKKAWLFSGSRGSTDEVETRFVGNVRTSCHRARRSTYGHVTRGRGRGRPVEHDDDQEDATEHGPVPMGPRRTSRPASASRQLDPGERRGGVRQDEQRRPCPFQDVSLTTNRHGPRVPLASSTGRARPPPPVTCPYLEPRCSSSASPRFASIKPFGGPKVRGRPKPHRTRLATKPVAFRDRSATLLALAWEVLSP
jgi:hypothetical protein